MTSEMEKFRAECNESIIRMEADAGFTETNKAWFNQSVKHRYSYNFSWMGRPIIQYPQDIVAMQEIIWAVKPDLIIETGVAHGGSLILYASLLQLLGGEGRVIGVDIDIRKHNREAIEQHPMFPRITLIEGSSIANDIVEKVKDFARNSRQVVVILDSNHTHEHVLEEIRQYSPLVTKGSYLVVFDTVVEDMLSEFSNDRPWGPGNSPKTAVHEFLQTNDNFIIDKQIQNKLKLTVAPDGYLRRVS